MKHMETDFQKDCRKFFNKTWKIVPPKLRPIVIIGLVFLSWIGGGWLVKRIPADTTSHRPTVNSACRFYTEVLANTKELERILRDIESGNDFQIANYKFIYDDYDRYDPAFGPFDLDQQIKNFYINLKKVSFGYTKEDIFIVKGLGRDVLSQLSKDYGCQDYFAVNPRINATSSDTVTLEPTQNVVSGSTFGILKGWDNPSHKNE